MNFSRVPVILVADDNPAVRHTIEIMFEDEPMALHYAEDGKIAYEKAVTLKPDVILLDIMMPELDGFEVCRMLREHADTREVPIVMVTALNDRPSRIHGIEAGADDFLTKPIDFLELKARVKTILRLNRYKSLQKERAQFRWAIDQSSEGYLLVDQQDDIVYANPQAREYLGLTRDAEITNQTNFLQVINKHFTRYPEYLWENWRKLSKQTLYLMIPENDKNRAFWLEVDVFPGPEDDPLTVVSLRNVSDVLNADQDFKKFHYLISHKLNTPLNGVYGMVELMNASIDEMPRSEIKELLQLAMMSAERLRRDVKEILNFLQASASARDGKGFKMSQVAGLAHQISKENGLDPATVRVATAAQGRSVVLSKVSFELILLELFENSKKFHPTHTPRVEMAISKIDEEMVSIKFIDDGLNLSVEQRAALVQPYQQTQADFSGEEKGFGLGIPMVVSILRSVGGELTVHNSPQGPGLMVEMLVPSSEVEDY